ncbi:MAG TPA: hypothetical protein VKD72_38205, partial [Gemmataceae bacterium]|nr:hypothetical protein [Gemmataceae bacterium]
MSEKRTRYRIALYALAACGLLGGGALVGRGLTAWWAPPNPPGHIVYLGDPEHPAFAPALLDEEPPARPARDGIANVSSRTSRLVRATGFPGMGKLFVAAPPPPPTVQESLQKMQKSIERLERLAPATEETLREYRDLAKSVRETIPELRDTNKELQKLIKNANDMVPMTRKALDEF